MITNFLQKIARFLLDKFGGNLFNLNAPYDYVQNVLNYNVHNYLGLDKSSIKSWCIVGGYLGDEIPQIMKNYPEVKITIFECSQRYSDTLRQTFKNNNRVNIINKAVSNSSGKVKFFETSLKCSGSLLKLGQLAKVSYGAEAAESFEVESITLDEYFGDDGIDVLQIDVQGAERMVIDGAKQVLFKTKAVFTEVSIKPNLYDGAVVFTQLCDLLEQSDFALALLGTDYNLTGNALFLKKDDSLESSGTIQL